ncbi:MAG: YutD family protein [Bacilli bacterium]|nr:YutD family protein [Bacilli bacterium]
MKKVKINEIEYELVKDDDCFDLDEIVEKLKDIDYFSSFDYIFGDYSYDKVRLKGFLDKKNPKVKEINNIDNLEDYKKNYCSFGCKTFLLKKVD